ncbi:hypothetical protein D3C76_965670 [compost metagenome]
MKAHNDCQEPGCEPRPNIFMDKQWHTIDFGAGGVSYASPNPFTFSCASASYSNAAVFPGYQSGFPGSGSHEVINISGRDSEIDEKIDDIDTVTSAGQKIRFWLIRLLAGKATVMLNARLELEKYDGIHCAHLSVATLLAYKCHFPIRHGYVIRVRGNSGQE